MTKNMLKKHKAIATTFANLGVLLVLQAADCVRFVQKEKQKEESTKGVAPAACSAPTTLSEKGAEEKPVAKVLPKEVTTETVTETETETETKAVAKTADTATLGKPSDTKSINVSEWYFNNDGAFVDKDEHKYETYVHNEKMYPELFDKAKEKVIEMLEKEGIVDNETCFASQEKKTNSKTLILAPGLAKAGAGIWSGSVLINEGLKTGSMLPIIKHAKKEGYNYFVSPKSKEVEDIRAAFDFVQKLAPSEEITIIAHSRGIEGVIAALKTDQNQSLKDISKVVYVGGGTKDDYSLKDETKNLLNNMKIFNPKSPRSGKAYNYTTPSDIVEEVLSK
jgi:hypothetical protein